MASKGSELIYQWSPATKWRSRWFCQPRVRNSQPPASHQVASVHGLPMSFPPLCGCLFLWRQDGGSLVELRALSRHSWSKLIYPILIMHNSLLYRIAFPWSKIMQ